MAVNLVSEPDEFTTAKPSCEWVLQMTDGGTSTLKKYATYSLIEQGVGLIGEVEIIEYTPQQIRVDFSDEILARLQTDLPGVEDTSAFPDPGLVRVFWIGYGEIEWNLETGERVEVQSSQSSPITVYRSSFQFYENDWMDQGPQIAVFSNKPERLDIAPGQADWVYFAVKTSTGAVRTTFVNKEEAPIFDTGFDLYMPGQAVGYPVGPLNHPYRGSVNWDDVFYYIVYLLGAAEVRRIRFYHKGCELVKDEVELYWLEPAGGYASIRMKSVDVGVSRVSNVFRQYGLMRGSISDRARRGGRRVGDVKGARVLTLRKDLDQRSYDLSRYYQGIFVTRETWIRMLDVNGNVIAAKFLIQDGDVVLSEDNKKTELVITGEIFKRLDSI